MKAETAEEKKIREREEMKARIQAMPKEKLFSHSREIADTLSMLFEASKNFIDEKEKRDVALKSMSVEGFKGSNKYIKFKFIYPWM